MPKYIVTFNSIVTEADDADEAIERATDAGGGHWEAVPVEAFGGDWKVVDMHSGEVVATVPEDEMKESIVQEHHLSKALASQEERAGRLRELMDERSIAAGVDYDYAHLMEIVDDGAYCARYAALTYDERYAFINLFDTEDQACGHLEISLGDDVSGGSIEGVVDLDTGKLSRATAQVKVTLDSGDDERTVPWPVLLDIRGQMELELQNANERVDSAMTEVRSDLGAISDALDEGAPVPKGMQKHSFPIQNTLAQLVAALARRQDSYEALVRINRTIEEKGSEDDG